MQRLIKFNLKISAELLVFCAILSFTQSIIAQQNHLECGSDAPNQEWEDKFQELISTYTSSIQNKSVQQSYTIPVIFHIIHGGEAKGTYPNLEQEQINSQITILNQDFNSNSYNIGKYPINAFKTEQPTNLCRPPTWTNLGE